MKKNLYAACLMLSALTLCADEQISMTKNNQTNLSPDPGQKVTFCSNYHRIEIGGNYTYARIKPEGNPTTSGSLGGTQFLYEYRPPKSVYTGLEFNWRIGTTTNDSAPSRSLQDFNLQERLGYTYCFSKYELRLTGFSGLGARYMPETVKSGSSSVDFDYATFYVPVGFLLDKKFTKMFALGINFQWLPQIFPTVLISPLTGTHWSLTYRLNNFFVEMPFTISACSNRFLVTIAPFFERWNDGKSTAYATRGFEGPKSVYLNLPGNRYLFTGVNVNFGVTF